MATKTITSASALLFLSVPGLFDTPVQLQGFSVDDIFDTEAIKPAEVMQGVDGKLSGGFVYVPTEQGIYLQADSDSNDFFETWNTNNRPPNDLFTANGTITLSALQKTYSMTKGFLTTYQPISNAKKVQQPRKFGITWELVEPAPFLPVA